LTSPDRYAVAAEVGATRVTVPADLLPEVAQMNGKVMVEAGAPGDRCIRYYMGTKLVQAQVP
jgi:transaldolase